MKNIFATYHHGFAGGSKNTSRLLHALPPDQFRTEGFFYELPQYFKERDTAVSLHEANAAPVRSEVIATRHLENYLLTEKILSQAKKKDGGILFAANMFPYCNIMFDVKSQMTAKQAAQYRLIFHPVGSDIWQIGTHFKSRVKWLLDSGITDFVVTYSRQFADEIADYYGVNKPIHVLPPVIESAHFYPLPASEKSARRASFDFGDEDFIIHHHSSMRRVKCPETVVEICRRAADTSNRPMVLIMTGPIPFDAIKRRGWRICDSKSSFSHETRVGKLRVYWTGLLTDVRFFMQLSDMELNCSLHDSFNIALMEAMACGLPVVTSDVAAVSEHIRACGGGYCYKTHAGGFDQLNRILQLGEETAKYFDVDSAVEMVARLAGSPAEAAAYGAIGASYVKKHFDSQQIVKAFIKLING